MSELSTHCADQEYIEIEGFLSLEPQHRFASIVADLIEEVGLSCDLPLKHTFVDGMYMREIFIPQGTVIVGAIHKKECANVLSSGSMRILDSEGEVIEVHAPFQAVSRPGVMKLGIALEDVIWTNVFKVDAVTVEDAEKEISHSGIETLRRIDPSGLYITKEKICQLESLLQLEAQ